MESLMSGSLLAFMTGQLEEAGIIPKPTVEGNLHYVNTLSQSRWDQVKYGGVIGLNALPGTTPIEEEFITNKNTTLDDILENSNYEDLDVIGHRLFYVQHPVTSSVALYCLYPHLYDSTTGTFSGICNDDGWIPLPQDIIVSDKVPKGCYSLMASLLYTDFKFPVCDQGSSMLSLFNSKFGKSFSKGGWGDELGSMIWWARGAVVGDAESQFTLASLLDGQPKLESVFNLTETDNEADMAMLRKLRLQRVAAEMIRVNLTGESKSEYVVMSLLKAAHMNGHVGATMALGDSLLHGIRTESSCRAAVSYLIHGAFNAYSMYEDIITHKTGVADCILNAKSRVLSLDEIDAMVKNANDRGTVNMYKNLGLLFTVGAQGVPQDFEKATYYLNLIIEKSEFEPRTSTSLAGFAHAALGFIEMTGSLNLPDFEVAFSHFNKSYTLYGNAMGAIGVGLFVDMGYVDSIEDAGLFYKIAADAQFPDGYFAYGTYLLKTNKNIEEALTNLHRALERGHIGSGYILSLFALHGSVTPEDCGIAATLMAKTGANQQWAISHQEYITTAYQKAQRLESSYAITKADVFGYHKFAGLLTAKLALAGSDCARQNLGSWLMYGGIDPLYMPSDSILREKYTTRLTIHHLESVFYRNSMVYQALGDVYMSNMAPSSGVLVEDMGDVLTAEGDVSHLIRYGVPTTLAIEDPDTSYFKNMFNGFMEASEYWDVDTADKSHPKGYINFEKPIYSDAYKWRNYQIARSHFRAARDNDGNPDIKCEASFAMGLMALLGQGGPIDIELAQIHFTYMAQYRPSARRVSFILMEILVPAILLVRKICTMVKYVVSNIPGILVPPYALPINTLLFSLSLFLSLLVLRRIIVVQCERDMWRTETDDLPVEGQTTVGEEPKPEQEFEEPEPEIQQVRE